MEINFKLSMNSGNSVFSGKIINTSLKNTKYTNLLWVEPTRCNGKFLSKALRHTVCISTENLVAKKS